ncbi:MAG: class I SAM-dependent methyltransferase [Candidatus Syntropharchaeia archaeon]
MRGIPCVRVPRNLGEKTRRKLIELGCFERNAKIVSDSDFIYIPTKRMLGEEELLLLGEAEQMVRDFEPIEEKKSTEDILGFAPSYEIIGDIAILKEGDERIGNAILETHKNIKVVLEPLTPVKGVCRTRKFRVIAGENRKETMYVEHGCRYFVHLEKVYFNPRLATERKRVVDQVEKNETVIDMFAGVGPFTIPIAKKAKRVIAIDINSDAVEYLKKNLALNRIKNVEVICGDVREVAPRLEGEGDRIIMNLPQSASEFLKEGMRMAKDRGIIHYYEIREEGKLFEEIPGVEIIGMRKVKSYAPRRYIVGIDMRIRKEKRRFGEKLREMK